MSILGKKKNKIEIDAEVVGVVGHKTVYVIFHVSGKPMANGLFCLTHPGNVRAREMQSSMIRVSQEDEDDGRITLNPGTRIRSFFSECVRPLKTGVSEIEKDLIQKYGANTAKLDPDEMHPKVFEAWERLQALFFGGDFWSLDLEDIAKASDGEGDS